MMKITRSNIEMFLTDYMEGNLQPDQAAELFAFLSENPDFEAEFENLEKLKLHPENDLHILKKNLKKDINKIDKITPENIEEFIIAQYENDLSEPAIRNLKNYLKHNPDIERTINLVRKLKIIPGNITFPDKPSLKKSAPRVIKLSYTQLISAAVIILLFGLFFLIGVKNEKPGSIVNEYTDFQKMSESIVPKIIKPDTAIQTVSFSEIEATDKNFYHRTSERNDTSVNKIAKYEAPSPPEELIAFLIPKQIFIENEIIEPVPLRSMQITRNKDGNKELYDSLQIRKNRFVKILKVGISGINTLTESDILLRTETDSTGRVQSFNLQTESFSLKRSFNRKKM